MIYDKHIQDLSNLILDYYPNSVPSDIQMQETRKDFIGDFTIVIFPLLKFSKKNILDTAQELGDHILKKCNYIQQYTIVKGFLNLEFKDNFWFNFLEHSFVDTFEVNNDRNKHVIIESCSPNTNKPLHLGHLRNIVLGDAIANILTADGNKVTRVQIINDRGIHICKSMLAWIKFGNKETPDQSNLKGDYLVGKYYVLFEKKYQAEKAELIQKGIPEKDVDKHSQLLSEAKKMLVQWEAGDKETLHLWKKMNSWVYDGFNSTYKKIGVHFDKIYYESDTYLLGKKYVMSGLDNDSFYQKNDDSVWVDLDNHGLDPKLLLRSDGTAVYITQDIGTAVMRYHDFTFDEMIYVVGNEQNHHFNVLFKILNKMGYAWSDNLFHLSYGMVNLPDGKMKSREGTVIDIDDLLEEMYLKSKSIILSSNKIDLGSIEDLSILIGDAALKYFILKPDAKKDILFDPEKSIDFNGHTGPFIQYTYARINSILEKASHFNYVFKLNRSLILEEKILIKSILNYPNIIRQSAINLNPAFLANYLYNLAKDYNHFYQKIPILNLNDINDVNFRVTISKKVSILIFEGMKLLGIKVPLKM